MDYNEGNYFIALNTVIEKKKVQVKIVQFSLNSVKTKSVYAINGLHRVTAYRKSWWYRNQWIRSFRETFGIMEDLHFKSEDHHLLMNVAMSLDERWGWSTTSCASIWPPVAGRALHLCRTGSYKEPTSLRSLIKITYNDDYKFIASRISRSCQFISTSVLPS
jgi:hypothetical protein